MYYLYRYLPAVCGGWLAAQALTLQHAHLNRNATFIIGIKWQMVVVGILISLLTTQLLSKAIHQLAYRSLNRSLIILSVGFLCTFITLFLLGFFAQYPMPLGETTATAHLLRKSYLPCLKIALGLNLVGFTLAYSLHTDKITDLSYGLTFLLIATYMFAHSERKSVDCIAYIMVALWACRLCFFLFRRILVIGKDHRFDTIRSDFWHFGAFWLLQAITASIVLLPLLLCLGKKNKAAGMHPLGYIGMFVFLLGLAMAHMADTQKFIFMQNPANKGKWIAHGLWRYSRHPNYAGEIVGWIGICVFAWPHLNPSLRVFASIGPCYICFLLVFVSGIPILEQRANERWQDDKAYQRYCERTSVLIPWLPG